MIEAAQNRGRLVTDAGLAGAEAVMTAPGTTATGPIPVTPAEWILGGATTAAGGVFSK